MKARRLIIRIAAVLVLVVIGVIMRDRKSTRLNSSHM